jgi:hypothetical protein
MHTNRRTKKHKQNNSKTMEPTPSPPAPASVTNKPKNLLYSFFSRAAGNDAKIEKVIQKRKTKETSHEALSQAAIKQASKEREAELRELTAPLMRDKEFGWDY